MIHLLILILAVALTFLITDYRRHLQIGRIEYAHYVKINDLDARSFEAGWKLGYKDAHDAFITDRS